MNFNSVTFVVIFLPVVLLAYHTVDRRLRLPILLVASLVFYGASGIPALASMVTVIVWAFLTAFLLHRFKNRAMFVLAISVPLFILFMFKYLSFFLNSVGAEQETRLFLRIFTDVLLPAGVSFYTFEAVSYSLDVKDGVERPERRFTHFATFIAAFPHLIAGPILRYSDVRNQFSRIETSAHLTPDWRRGAKFIAFGFAGKVVFSDFFAMFLDRVTALGWPNVSTSDALFVFLAYSFHIYYDFWAYSLIAIGLGLMLDINFPRNFLEPYLSRNPKEFWRRWHVTLSFWLRDYVYLRLGGNENYIRNIIVIFLVCGLWHGAGWNFVLWGAYHAVLVILYHVGRRLWDRLFVPIQIALTFALVSLGWPLFFLDIDTYLLLLGKLAGSSGLGGVVYQSYHWVFALAVAVATFGLREAKWLYNSNPRFLIDSPYVHALLIFGTTMIFTLSRTFVYFRF